jgi:hypothetical protein
MTVGNTVSVVPIASGLRFLYSAGSERVTTSDLAAAFARGKDAGPGWELVRRLINGGYVEFYVLNARTGRGRLGYMRLSARGKAAHAGLGGQG